MATETYIPLAEVTLVATANYCDFTSISQDYSDLVLVFECEGSASNRINGYLNGSAADYRMLSVEQDGGPTSANYTANSYFNAGVCRSGSKSINIVQLMGYSDTDKHTGILSQESAASARLGFRVMSWANTAAVTSVRVSCSNGTFNAGSTFKLFGIHGEVV